MKKILIAALFLTPAAGAGAEDLAALRALKAAGGKAESAPAPAAVPVPAAENSLLISGNDALLEEFENSFGYKVNGQIYFGYHLADLRFYALTGQPGRLLVQIEDRALPAFYNFIALEKAAGSDRDFQVLYRYDSQKEKTAYTAAMLPEKACALDAECAYWAALKKSAEAGQTATTGTWEDIYIAGVKAELLKKAGDRYDSAKFSALGGTEVRGAKARLGEILAVSAAAAGGKAGLRGAVEAAWKTELCGASSAEFMERLKHAAPAEQDKMILRCGFYQDADLLISTEYDSLLLAQLHGACAAGTNPARQLEYCAVYNTWSALYALKTRMEERRPDGGRLRL